MVLVYGTSPLKPRTLVHISSISPYKIDDFVYMHIISQLKPGTMILINGIS